MWFKIYISSTEQLLQAIKCHTNLQNINNSLKLTWSGIILYDKRLADSVKPYSATLDIITEEW